MSQSEPLRNDRSVVVKNTLIVLFVVVLAMLWAIGSVFTILLIVAVMVVAVVMLYIYWKRTLIYFMDNDIVIERNTVFKSKKTIPYNKIASINADRDVVDRIFGTMKLKININSSKNATAPEAILTFKMELAEKIRAELSEHIFAQIYDKEVYDSQQSVVSFTKKDLMLHGLFSLSSYQTITTVILLIYSFISPILTGGDFTGMAIALLMVVILEVIPMTFIIIRFYDFKIFRMGDTIHIQHGAIQNYKSSFEVSRINAVRIRRTFFARLMGRAYIEAEVVGIGGTGGNSDARPMICILSKESSVQKIMDTIIPEFIYQHVPEKQPSEAKWPMLVNAIIAFAVIIPIMVFASLYVSDLLVEYNVEGMLKTVALMVLPVITAIAVITSLLGIVYSVRLKEFDMGEDMFTFQNGILDRETVIMNYDKVQIVQIRSGVVARRFKLARCRISMLAAVGGQSVTSGYFPQADLSKIADRMLERVNARLSGVPA